jgi:F-type H+-transporting ATPase subunit b
MAEPAAHSQVPAGHPAFPPFQAEHFPSQLAWLAVSFVLLFKEQSDAAHAAYEKALADARARAQAIAAETRQRQAAAAEATNKRLEAQLHERLAAAEQSIAATRTAAMDNVGAIARDTASAIVERLIGQAPAEHEVAAALGDALKR